MLERVLARKIELETKIKVRTPPARRAVDGSACRQQQDDLASELRPRSNVHEELGDLARNFLGMKLAEQFHSFGHAALGRYAEHPVVRPTLHEIATDFAVDLPMDELHGEFGG